jgi:hypothetical protein
MLKLAWMRTIGLSALSLGYLLTCTLLTCTLCNASAQEPLRLGPGKVKSKAPINSKSSDLANSLPAPKQSQAAPEASAKPLEVTPLPGQSIAQAWDALFTAQRQKAMDPTFQASIRAKVRTSVVKQDFAAIREIISSALRNDAAQPWMYEALALAMEADWASEKEIERAILSSVDISRDFDSALTTAAYLSAIKLDRAAFKLFQEVSTQDPLRSEPYLQALQSAQNLKDPAAIQWCCLGILKQAWPSDQSNVELHARRVAEANLRELKKQGAVKQADLFKAQIAAATQRDVRVTIRWTGDADVDLSVLDPSGEVCSYRNPATSGGLIQGDAFARSTTNPPRDGYTETFYCPEAFSGEYQVMLKRAWGEVAGGKVNVEVITHYGGKNELIDARMLPLGAEGTLVKFTLVEGRRTQSLPQARSSVATNRQIEVARHVLAQRVSSGGGSQSEQSYYSGNAPLAVDPLGRLAFPIARGAVGFRPQLTTLQDGPTLFAGPAVVSADRRFVRMSLSPQFQTIGDVQTFNFATGDVGNGNGTGNTGGGAGGAGGGAGT